MPLSSNDGPLRRALLYSLLDDEPVSRALSMLTELGEQIESKSLEGAMEGLFSLYEERGLSFEGSFKFRPTPPINRTPLAP